MAVTPDNAMLIVAECYARRLTAFDIAADGRLSNRRVWADLLRPALTA
jgi:sugar lactone lactonase YvrE